MESHFPKLVKFLRKSQPEFYVPLTCLIYDLGMNNPRIRVQLYNTFKKWEKTDLLSGYTLRNIDSVTKQLEQRFPDDFGMKPKSIP